MEVYVADRCEARKTVRVSELAQMLGYSTSYLSRQFRRATGVTLTRALKQEQVRRAELLLVLTPLITHQIATATGFGTTKQFYRVFRAMCRTTPATYRAQAIETFRRRQVMK